MRVPCRTFVWMALQARQGQRTGVTGDPPQPTQLVFRKASVPRGCWWWQAVVLEAKSVRCPWRSSLFVETRPASKGG